MMTTTEHSSLGASYRRHAPVLQFSGTPGRALPFCDLGEHSRRILAELGYEDTQIDDLHESGVVGWQPELTATPAT
jgi:crotonobetainyl-CoA:carnitine CoA-transferase CaiB-like acyl-CoA transferase